MFDDGSCYTSFVRWLPFGFGYIYAGAVLAGALLRGPWLFAPPLLSFAILPLVDATVGLDLWNPSPEREREMQHNLAFRLLTWAWVPVGIGVTAFAIVTACSPSWTWSDRLALAAGVGLMNSVVGIVYAHELVHQAHRVEQLLGEALLTLVSYPHFRVEHVFGHHRFVGTPRDPATARLGEDFYRFWLRTVPGQIRSAWALECERLQRAKRPRVSSGNRMLVYAAVLLSIYSAIGATLGWAGVALFALQSVVAFTSLEVINYLEHYGLERVRRPDGTYEPVRALHSWNAPQRVTNWFLINLGRHSDHHAVASRRWQILRTYDDREAPALPSGYAVMYLAALVPPLWFAVMNPRARARRSSTAAAQ